MTYLWGARNLAIFNTVSETMTDLANMITRCSRLETTRDFQRSETVKTRENGVENVRSKICGSQYDSYREVISQSTSLPSPNFESRECPRKKRAQQPETRKDTRKIAKSLRSLSSDKTAPTRGIPLNFNSAASQEVPPDTSPKVESFGRSPPRDSFAAPTHVQKLIPM